MPTFSRNCSRSEISRRISRATCRSVSDSSTSSSHSSARRAESAQKSSIRVPATSTARDSGAQARAAAHRARAQRHELLDLLPRPLGVGLAVAALEVLDDPLEARRVGALAPVAVAVADLHAAPRSCLPGTGHDAPGRGPPTALRGRRHSARRSPPLPARSSWTCCSPTAPVRLRRSTASGRARPAPGRSPSASPAPCSGRRRRGGS